MTSSYINFAFAFVLLLTTTKTEYLGCKNQHIELNDVENASVIIGGLFPVHYWHQKYQKYVLNKPGLLWVEAMIFAIDEINKSSFLQNKKVGYRIHDSCNNISIAIESALEITQGFTPYKAMVGKDACQCNSLIKRAIALVGDAASDTSVNVAAILSSTGTTQISYSATSTDLNANLYPTFLRTILPDNFQAVMIADLLLHNNWTYVSIIACDDDYGRVGFSELLSRLQAIGVCIAVKEIYDIKGDPNTYQMKLIIKKLIKEKKANIIVLWCQRPEALRFLKTAELLDLYNKTWIATETYGFSNEIYDINPNVVKGMLGIIPLQVSFKPFETRLKSITPNSVYKNPWIQEYWQELNCTINNEANCSNFSLNDLPKSKYAEVIHAVQSIAMGLRSFIEVESPLTMKPQKLLSYIKNVSFIGINNLSISYDEQGNPRTAGYSITNLKQNDNKKLFWEVVASWDYSSRKIKLISDKQIIYSGGSAISPFSSCKEKCKPGYFALSFESSCCWECVRCANDSIQPIFGQGNCSSCTGNKIPNMMRTKCVIPKQIYIMADSKEGVCLILFSAIVLLLAFFSAGSFLKYKETPIVKASNINLSLMQLLSIMFTLMLPFFCIQKVTTKSICSGQLTYFACFNSITVSVTFIKADRLLRIFNCSKSGHLPGRLRNTTIVQTYSQCFLVLIAKQFLPVAVLTFTSIVLCIAFFFSFPIEVSSELTILKDDDIKIEYFCGGYYDIILFSVIAYVVLIASICGVYAFKARNMPATHNEAQLTCLAMFLFMLSWLLFIPTYMSADDYKQKLIVWCFMSNTSTSCFFLAMYSPKLYFIYFKADENTNARFRAKITQFIFTNLKIDTETDLAD
ncbi:extracellular calcium-sensing receptor [Hydra vulgaris]|uniref:Extracellular calcium-sensing receptor n=1 Tax=Hydra vulgaris TaxID=6087 RepID=A0ABM4BLN4_HYDVU